MSVFIETMKQSISIYRQMLRKHLPQAERISKLNQLHLKNPQLYENEIALYHTGYAIVTDIESNLYDNTAGYYSYSGVENFAQHLKAFLENYEIEHNRVIHRSQKASRALVQAIQLLASEKLTDAVSEKLARCNRIIAKFGSEDQRKLHEMTLQNTLTNLSEKNIIFYRDILNNFHQHMQDSEIL